VQKTNSDRNVIGRENDTAPIFAFTCDYCSQATLIVITNAILLNCSELLLEWRSIWNTKSGEIWSR